MERNNVLFINLTKEEKVKRKNKAKKDRQLKEKAIQTARKNPEWVNETINGHDILHNIKAVRFEIDEKVGVRETIEINWEDGSANELDRAYFV